MLKPILAKLATLIASAALLGSLTACGGSSGSSSSAEQQTTSVTVTGSLGQIRNAEARLLDLDLVPIVDALELGPDGTATFTVPVTLGAFIAEIVGDADAEYFDEATGTYLPLPGSARIRAVLPALQALVGVNTLTEVAVAQLEAAAGGLQMATAATIRQTNNAIRDLLLPGISDITLPPTVVGSGSDVLGSSTADLYALFLAALAEMATGDSSPALTIMQQLVDDLRDGVFDGLAGSTAIPGAIVTSLGQFDALFDTAVAAALLAFGDGVVDLDDIIDFRTYGGGLTGDWTLVVSGTVTSNGITTNIPAGQPTPLPAAAVPSQGVFDGVEQEFINAFALIGTVSNTSFNITTETDTEVVVAITGTVSIPAGEGIPIPVVSDYNLVYTYTRL